MWQIIIRTPEKGVKIVDLKPGKLTLGREATNDIVIDDISASRHHAEILFDPSTNMVSLIDLHSTNGTYVNRQQIKLNCQLGPDDIIRIGQVVMQLSRPAGEKIKPRGASGTHNFTRELLLEAIDQQALVLYEVSRKLNTITEVENIVKEIKEILTKTLSLNSCSIILAEPSVIINTAEFSNPVAKKAVHEKSVEVTHFSMFAPIINVNSNQVVGLITMQKKQLDTRPFDKHDLQLAITICYQAALTLQRVELLKKVQHEEYARNLLLRFVSPPEVELMLKDYLHSGKLPELSEQKVTVLFSDIANSTQMAETLGPKQFASILTNFYDTASDLIFQHGGMIKYLGDGILAIFPQTDAQIGEQSAVLVGRKLISHMEHTGALEHGHRTIIGVAINTGQAMVGYIGIKGRPEFNVIGDAVNIAFRLQEHARPYKIVVGEVTADALDGKFNLRELGAIRLKGREQAVYAYEVLPGHVA